MSIINTLITDRTNDDLVNDTDRAYIAYTDLNRIEEACAYLGSELGVELETKVWHMEDFRTESEMARLRGNIQKLRNAYFIKQSTPQLPARITYTSIYQANRIEQILADIDEMIRNVKSGVNRLSFKLGTKTLGNRR